MRLIHTTLSEPEPLERTGAGATARAMEWGQHAMAVLLAVVAVVRASGDGVPLPIATLVGAAVLAWHTAGALLPSTSGARRRVVWWLLGFAAIWVIAVAVSAEFVWLAFLLWLLAGHLLPLRGGLVFSGLVLAVAIAALIVHHGATSYANVLGPLIGGVFAFGISRGYLQLLRDAAERERLVASLTRAQEEAAALQDELVLAQRHSGAVAERTRIARDIHDSIAQALSSIRLLAHAASSQTSDDAASETLRRLESLAGDSLTDVRRIVAALTPAALEDEALAAALGRMLDRVRDETGIRTELRIDETVPSLPPDVEVALLRTAQSALANVRQHSAARRVVVSLIDADDTVRLDIIDDGDGFDPASWDARPPTPESSFGLIFMRDRLRELAGGLDVESTPGDGTAISAHLPLRTSGAPDDTAQEPRP